MNRTNEQIQLEKIELSCTFIQRERKRIEEPGKYVTRAPRAKTKNIG